MKHVPLFIKYRRLVVTIGVQKSNEWIESRLFCSDNEVFSLCATTTIFSSDNQESSISRKVNAAAAAKWKRRVSVQRSIGQMPSL